MLVHCLRYSISVSCHNWPFDISDWLTIFPSPQGCMCHTASSTHPAGLYPETPASYLGPMIARAHSLLMPFTLQGLGDFMGSSGDLSRIA